MNICFRPHLPINQYLYRFSHSHGSFNCETLMSNGRKIVFSSGTLAKLSDGACVATIGNTNVLVTVVSKNRSVCAPFFPLTVDYREKSAAFGRIPTNFFRRDLGPSEREILTARLIDRSIRTSFPPGYYGDTNVTCNLLSVDSSNEPDIAAINAASAALSLSNTPWDGPIAAVRVSLLNKEIIINPTRKEMNQSDCNLVVTSHANKNVLMLEGNCNRPISMDDLLLLIQHARKENSEIIHSIKVLSKIHGRNKKKFEPCLPTKQQIDHTLLLSKLQIEDILKNHKLDKLGRDTLIFDLHDKVVKKLKETYKNTDPSLFTNLFVAVFKQIHQDVLLTSKRRVDGRSVDQIRPLFSQVNMYPPLHGSALFQRGQTQVLGTVSFDSPDSALRPNQGFIECKEKKFMLHYDFPKYATNDIGKAGGVGRREIGHGALAEKALRPLVPDDSKYTIRLTAEVLESNGSSSMASVCAGSMALMDAGVELKEHVAGVAMGLLFNKNKLFENVLDSESNEIQTLNESKNDSEHLILTDLTGFEDFYGEMDFKIAGTLKGFTALQLDCKTKEGLTMNIVTEALAKAKVANAKILTHMVNTISKPKKEKENWPVISEMAVPLHKRASFMGWNSFNLKKLKQETGVSVYSNDNNPEKFTLFAPNKDAMDEAQEYFDSVLTAPKEPILNFGGIYTAKIVDIKPKGVMITLYQGMKPIFLSNQELDRKRVVHPSALGLKLDDEIQVQYFGRDPNSGTMRVSRRVLQMSTNITQNFVSEK